MTADPPPTGICPNCWATYRAAHPRPLAVYCCHQKVAARRSKTGWKVVANVTPELLQELRDEGAL